jgi:hypothetical protein
MLKTAKPSFANHRMFVKEWGERYAIASCYNGLKKAGGGYTLPRMRLYECSLTAKDVDDFLNVLEQVESYSDGRIHTAFAGVEYSEGNEKRLTPIKKGDLRFEPLAEALIEMKPNATVISTSPLLEHDAMYMKIILERVLAKKVAKDMKERKKAEMAAASE